MIENMKSRGLRLLWLALVYSSPIAALVLYLFGHAFGAFDQAYWDTPEGSDAILQAVGIKTIVETGWTFNNPRLGAPFGTALFDFAGADAAMNFGVKLIALFTSDATRITNIFFLVSFIGIYAASLWTLLRLGISRPWAIAGSLIFSTLPYHFLRGINHLYLATYYIVPLWIWLAIETFDRSAQPVAETTRFKWWPTLLVSALGGISGIYYAFFGLLITALAALLGTHAGRNFRSIQHASIVFIVTGACTVANLLPNFFHWAMQGSNQTVATRAAIESDLYGLRIAQLLLPIWGHPIDGWARFARTYHDALRPVTEATSSGLGFITGIGFLILIGALFVNDSALRLKRLRLLSQLNISLLLFGTVGGFAVIFALAVTPQFRGVARVSIFIAFISLLAMLLWLDAKSHGWLNKSTAKAWGVYVLAGAIAVFAVLEQTPVGARPSSRRPALPSLSTEVEPAAGTAYGGDLQAFIKSIEAKVSKGGMVYVLPYLEFPEAAPAFQEGYNGMLRPYYYSDHVRWSFGAMKGRPGDAWLKKVESLPVEQKLMALQQTGFEGIYIERRAFKDRGQALESALRAYVSHPVMESASGNQAFYPLDPISPRIVKPELILLPGKGFYPTESDRGSSWNWAADGGTFVIHNYTNAPLRIRFTAQILGISDRPLEVRISSHLVQTLQVKASAPLEFTLEHEVPAGRTHLEMRSPSPPLNAPNDPRRLGFRVIDAKAEPS